MSNISQVKLDEYISEALVSFGKEVNTNRQLVNVMDGTKPVYRRVIYTTLKFGTKMTKTQNISGQCLALHPHGDASINPVVSSLVRWGIFEGQGNHGLKMIYGDDIEPSAPRYTEARMDPKWASIFSELIPYVPYKEAELEGQMEPEYIPTPIPLTLLFSGMGIGFGINSRYPMFTAKSLFDAYQNDDPSLLKAPFGLDIDYSRSELDSLWRKGIGKITYKYQLSYETLPSGNGVMITGSAELFKPALETAFRDELDRGRVYILDQTSSESKVFVGRTSGSRFTVDEIYEICEKICSLDKTFRLSVTDGNESFLIPLKEWLHLTVTNYYKLIDDFKNDKISKLNFDYDVYDWLPLVTETLLANRDMTAEDIAKKLKCNLDVVKAVLRKSISTLKMTDSTGKLKEIKAEIKKYKSINPNQYTIDLINKF